MEDSLMSIIFGDNYNDKQGLFSNELLAIQEKHIEYFKSREAKYDSEPHDLLHHHYVTKYENGEFWFWWRKDSDLPQEIINECEEAYRQVLNV